MADTRQPSGRDPCAGAQQALSAGGTGRAGYIRIYSYISGAPRHKTYRQDPAGADIPPPGGFTVKTARPAGT